MFKLSLIVLGMMLMFNKEIHAGEESLYDFLWLDPDKKVYVLQNKLYKKEHSLYFDVGYLTNYTSKFQDTAGYALKGGYLSLIHISEPTRLGMISYAVFCLKK